MVKSKERKVIEMQAEIIKIQEWQIKRLKLQSAAYYWSLVIITLLTCILL